MTADIGYDESICKSVADIELKKFSHVVEEHSKTLERIVTAVTQYPLPEWQARNDPVNLQFSCYKDVDISEVFASLSQAGDSVSKTVLVLSSLCIHIQHVVDDVSQQLFMPIVLYGDALSKECEADGEMHLAIGRTLPVLQKISCFVHHAKEVAKNVICQLAALYPQDRQSRAINITDIHLQVVFEHLASLLGTLVILDELIVNNSMLCDHWSTYRKLSKSALSNPDVFGQEKKSIFALQDSLHNLEKDVLSGTLFKNAVKEVTDDLRQRLAQNLTLSGEMFCVILGWSKQIEQSLSESSSADLRRMVIDITSLGILYMLLFSSHRDKICKILTSLYRKVPCISLPGANVWFGEKYLSSFPNQFEKYINKKSVDLIKTHRISYLTQRVSSLSKEIAVFEMQISEWHLNLRTAAMTPTIHIRKSDLSSFSSLIVQGLSLSHSLKDTVETILNLHVAFHKPVSKTCVLQLCRLVENLKKIGIYFKQYYTTLAQYVLYLVQFSAYELNGIIIIARNRLMAQSQSADVITALRIVEEKLQEVSTKERRTVARVALSIAASSKTFKDEEFSSLLFLLKRWNILSELQVEINEATSCSFLYHHSVIFGLYFENYFQTVTNVERIHVFLLALEDCLNDLCMAHHLKDLKSLSDHYCENVMELIKAQFLDKLCQAVETELRLSIHVSRQIKSKKTAPPFNSFDLKKLLHLSSLHIGSSVISVRDYVTNYLEKIFYSLTVLSPHDWKIYEEMRNLAFLKFALQPSPSHLPSHCTEQCSDALEITRNIDHFVQHYMYSMHQQFFIEANNDSKYLNVVSVDHIINSIRMHGLGIINTTVNYTYQFLRKKFRLFSHFLYDEQIKSRLLKEHMFWTEGVHSERSFPYERAVEFHQNVLKLGSTKEGLTFLDQFRITVTQIGNVMGYVRLVNAAGLQFTGQSSMFLPKVENVDKFSLLSDESVSPETRKAAQNLDSFTDILEKNISGTTDYFRLLINVFATVLRDDKNQHLKYFYLILPTLMINFVNYFVVAKDALSKKNKAGAAFTDDGFAFGVAYLLQVLSQKEAFDSLNWWTGVKEKFEKDTVDTERHRGSEKLQETLSLTLSRLQAYQREFELLSCGVSTAQVFLRKGSAMIKRDTTVVAGNI